MSVSTKQRMVGSAVAQLEPKGRGAGPASIDADPTGTDFEVPSSRRDPASAAYRVVREPEHIESVESVDYHDTIPAPPPDDFDDGD
jgi:hypothetical protein